MNEVLCVGAVVMRAGYFSKAITIDRRPLSSSKS